MSKIDENVSYIKFHCSYMGDIKSTYLVYSFPHPLESDTNASPATGSAAVIYSFRVDISF